MSQEFFVRASSSHASFNAGRFIASSPAAACRQAREKYTKSPLGRSLNDVRQYRFYTVSKADYEEEESGD